MQSSTFKVLNSLTLVCLFFQAPGAQAAGFLQKALEQAKAVQPIVVEMTKRMSEISLDQDSKQALKEVSPQIPTAGLRVYQFQCTQENVNKEIVERLNGDIKKLREMNGNTNTVENQKAIYTVAISALEAELKLQTKCNQGEVMAKAKSCLLPAIAGDLWNRLKNEKKLTVKEQIQDIQNSEALAQGVACLEGKMPAPAVPAAAAASAPASAPAQ
jgi:hypothetical protein